MNDAEFEKWREEKYYDLEEAYVEHRDDITNKEAIAFKEGVVQGIDATREKLKGVTRTSEYLLGEVNKLRAQLAIAQDAFDKMLNGGPLSQIQWIEIMEKALARLSVKPVAVVEVGVVEYQKGNFKNCRWGAFDGEGEEFQFPGILIVLPKETN